MAPRYGYYHHVEIFIQIETALNSIFSLFTHRMYLTWIAIVLGVCVPVMAESPITSALSVGFGNIQGFNFSSEAIFENPASLRLKSKASVSSFYTTYMGGENKSMVLSVGYKLNPEITIGAGFIENSIDGLLSTKENLISEFETTGTFGYRESHYFFGGSIRTDENLSFGASATYISQQFGSDFGQTLQLNIGSFYKVGEYGFSLVGKNVLGSKMRFNDGTSQEMERQLSVGTQYRPEQLPKLSLFGEVSEVIANNHWTPLGGVGAGYYLIPGVFELRGGWRQIYSSGKVTSTKSLGLGIEVKPFMINYAYELADYVVQQDTHFISLQMNL